MPFRIRKNVGRASARFSVVPCGIAGLQVHLDQVFDRPVDGGSRFYRHSSGQLILDPGPHADVACEVWWTFGQPVDDSAIIDEAEWFGWVARIDELGFRRALFLTDVPIDSELQARFGVRPNVLSVSRGRVAVSYSDDPSFALAVSRFGTVAELMAD